MNPPALTQIILVSTLVGSASALANDGSKLFELTLDELLSIKVVTSTQRQQNVKNAPSVIDVFTRKDIELIGAQNLIELLNYSPSIETSLAPDGFYRVAIRGERKDGNILFLLDGHKLNDIYNGQAIYDFPTALIEQLEIIRGPGSALYGTNAVSGIINILPRSSNASVRTSYGNNHSRSFDVHYSRVGPVTLNTTVSYRDSEGDSRQLTVRNLANSTSFSSDTNYFTESLHLLNSIDYQNWNSSLYFASHNNGDWGGPNFNLGTQSDFEKQSTHFSLTRTIELSDTLLLTPKLFLSSVDHDYLYNDLPVGFVFGGNVFEQGGFTREKYQANRRALELELEKISVGDWHFINGLMVEHQSLSDYSFSRNYSAISLTPFGFFDNHDNVDFVQANQKRRIKAAFTQARFLGKKFELTLGARLDDYNDFGSSFNPRIGLIYDHNRSLSFKTLFASAFRAPTLKELYDITLTGNNGVRGNASLNPETVDTFELAAEYNRDDLILRVNGFYSESKDVIGIYDAAGSGAQAVYDNLGNTESFGIEVEIEAIINQSLTLMGSFGQHRTDFYWSDEALFAEERIYQETRGHTQLVHTPRIRANLLALFNYQRVSLAFGLHYGGKSGPNNRTVIESFRGVRGDNVIIDDYLLAEFNLNYLLSDNHMLTLRAINLGDDKYSDPDESSNINIFGPRGLIQPDESVSVAWRYKF